MDSRLNIEIALKASMVAKSALEFVDGVSSSILLRLKFKGLVERVSDLQASVRQAAAEEDRVADLQTTNSTK